MAGGIDGFLYHVLAFGAASEQILTTEVDDKNCNGITIESATAAIVPLMDLIFYFIDEYNAINKYDIDDFKNLVINYKKWIVDNGKDNWKRNVAWVGVTAFNLKKMLGDRYVVSEAKRERWEQMWMIYFGLKSVIGRKQYVQMSWEFILIRSMGFFNTKEYDNYFKKQQNWITPLLKRKAKEWMIKRLEQHFNLVYATHTPTKGERPEVAQWSFQKGFKWVSKSKKGTS
ncbi:MAG: hypothetical protein NC131_18400 [Roseburia sp.]|nr:hypothetical protein [Roseburia sp.]